MRRLPQPRSTQSKWISKFVVHNLFMAVLVLSLTAVPTTDASIVITVPWKDEECYVFRTPLGPESSFTVSGNFDLLDDSLDGTPITVVVLNEELRLLYRSPYGVSESTFELPNIPMNSRLSLCFQNGTTRRSKQRDDNFDRTLGFEIRMTPTLVVENEIPLETKRLLEEAESLQTKLYDLLNHQDYLRDRESIHRELTETTFSRLVRWTMAEAICLVLVAVAQVVYLRKFFETRRSL